MSSDFVRPKAPGRQELSVDIEARLIAVELTTIALLATSQNRSAVLECLEDLAVMTESLISGSTPGRRKQIAGLARERIAGLVLQAGGQATGE